MIGDRIAKLLGRFRRRAAAPPPAPPMRLTCDLETTGDIISRADGERVSLNALADALAERGRAPRRADQ